MSTMTQHPSNYPVSSYEKHGIAFPFRVLTDEGVAHFRAAVDDLHEELGGQPDAGKLGQTHLNFPWA